VLSLSFDSRPAESDILLSLILQLGQDPSLLSYQNNPELFSIFIDAQAACGCRAILFDEAHHLWLAVPTKRIADRAGGRLGDFLKRLYDESGLAFVFSGTKGLETLIATDSQASTRWSGKIRLEKFEFNERFIGMLTALDNALPMEEPSDLSKPDTSKKIFDATQGNFRLIKNLIAEAVFLASTERSPKVTNEFLSRAYFLTFCDVPNPFSSS